MSITLRNVLPSDADFLFGLYASTRASEMALVDWPDEQKTAFLRMQFQAQRQFYSENYPGASFQVVLLDGKPAGRLYTHRREEEIRIMDIALLPEYRNQGIGTGLLARILAQGEEDGLPVTIHVERFNPAMRLYERLGFCFQEERGVYLLMEWKPAMKEANAHAG